MDKKQRGKPLLSRISVKKRTPRKIIRVVLVEDHQFLRDALRLMFDKACGITIVGESDNGADAITLIQDLRPDVCIMDIMMKGLNGIDATRRIIMECPGTRVLAFSASLRRQCVAQMIQAGASGYVVKTCSSVELIEAVRTVARGEQFFSPEILAGYFEESQSMDSTLSAVLTERERTVVELIAHGKSTNEIADIMALSARTVEAHRMKIIRKLGASTVADIVRFAIKEGILKV